MDTSSEANAKSKERVVVFLDAKSSSKHKKNIYQKVGARCMSSMEAIELDVLGENEAVILDSLGIAIFNMPRDVLEKQFGVNQVMGELKLRLPKTVGPVASLGSPLASVAIAAAALTDDQETWGRKAVRAPARAPTGSGVKVCIVDSGLDTDHPDFVGRPNTTLKGFPRATMVEDFNGHGTHCAGIICGPASIASPPRYGVAPGVELFVANVFGASADTSAALVMTAVEWAISQHCDIVSLSLQAEEDDGAHSSLAKDVRQFERLAKRALKAGTLLVACTGNSSDRDDKKVKKAAFPARCPSVLAVGGITNRIEVMSMSNSGAEVFGPGDAIQSATMGGTHGALSGTSMAAAFVSGVAALYAERHPNLRGIDLLTKLRNSGGTSISLPRNEFPASLVLSPA